MAAAFRPWGFALLVLGLVGLCRPAGASVILQTGNFSVNFIDLPADFGPDVPEEGLTGLLLVANPEDACSSLRPPPASKTPWVALVARSQNIEGCTFDIKVAQAEAAGAIAAIIFDDAIEPLILMAKDPRHPDPFIPAVFVSHRSGLMMKRLIEEGKTVVMLTPSSEAIWLSMLMSACAGFLAVNIVLGALWVMRRQRIVAGGGGSVYGPLQQQGMSLESIRQLPIVVYEEPAGVQAGREAADGGSSSGGGGSGSAPLQQRPDGGSDSGSDSGRKGGGTRHTCAICLESYQNSDKLRVLPCQHRYHSECVDQWLSSRHPCCPVCKADAHPRTPGDDLEAGTAGPPRWQRRGMLLLGRLGGGWIALRTRFVGSGAEGAAADGEGGGGSAAGERTALLLGSRSGSPAPPAGPLVQPVATQAAQVAAQQARFPASASSSGVLGVPSAGVQPEITPVEASDSGVAATTFVAISTTIAAAPTTNTATAGTVSPRVPASAAQTVPLSDLDGSPPCSSGPSRHASPGTSYCAAHAVGPDSTEGSETDSEAE